MALVLFSTLLKTECITFLFCLDLPNAPKFVFMNLGMPIIVFLYNLRFTK